MIDHAQNMIFLFVFYFHSENQILEYQLNERVAASPPTPPSCSKPNVLSSMQHWFGTISIMRAYHFKTGGLNQMSSSLNHCISNYNGVATSPWIEARNIVIHSCIKVIYLLQHCWCFQSQGDMWYPSYIWCFTCILIHQIPYITHNSMSWPHDLSFNFISSQRILGQSPFHRHSCFFIPWIP